MSAQESESENVQVVNARRSLYYAMISKDSHTVSLSQTPGLGRRMIRPLERSSMRKPSDDDSSEPFALFRWYSGLDYGVVLGSLHHDLARFGTSGQSPSGQLSLEINPLLMPLTTYDLTQESIVWNVLFDTNYAFLATSRSSRSWNDACDEPATFPRLSSIQLCSPCFPWVVSVSNELGVTCGDVLDKLHEFLDGTVEPAEFESFSRPFKTSVSAAFDLNRRTARGRRFYGPKVRRGDVLLTFTTWRGLVYSEKYIAQQVGKPPGATLVVLLDPPTHVNGSSNGSHLSLAASYVSGSAFRHLCSRLTRLPGDSQDR